MISPSFVDFFFSEYLLLLTSFVRCFKVKLAIKSQHPTLIGNILFTQQFLYAFLSQIFIFFQPMCSFYIFLKREKIQHGWQVWSQREKGDIQYQIYFNTCNHGDLYIYVKVADEIFPFMNCFVTAMLWEITDMIIDQLKKQFSHHYHTYKKAWSSTNKTKITINK